MLDRAGKEAEALGDEYVSTEHLLLALLEERGPARERAARRGRDPRRASWRRCAAVRGGRG